MGAPVPVPPQSQETAGAEGTYLARRRDFYVYTSQTTPGTPIPASGVQTDAIQIGADANFILQKLAYHCQAPAGTTLAASALGLVDAQLIQPAVALQIVDTSSGRQLMQNPVPIPALFGNGRLPFILPNPRLFMRNSTIQITYTNFDATNVYTIRLAFMGYKIYGTA
jgi:hypothetical protein